MTSPIIIYTDFYCYTHLIFKIVFIIFTYILYDNNNTHYPNNVSIDLFIPIPIILLKIKMS